MLLMLITKGEYNKLVDLLHEVALVQECVLNKKDNQGNTPFNIACQNGNYKIVEALISGGADMNTSNNDGNTPLHYACTYNFPDIVKLLVLNGANQTIKNEEGKNPWEGI